MAIDSIFSPTTIPILGSQSSLYDLVHHVIEHGRDFAQSVQEVDERADIENLIEILLEKGIAAWAIEKQMARLRAKILAELEITEEILAGLQLGVRERIEQIVSGEVLRRLKEQSCLSGYHPHPLYVVCTHFPE